MNLKTPLLSLIGPTSASLIIPSLLAALAGCSGAPPETEADPPPVKVGVSQDGTCPEDEPRTMEACDTDGQTCTYTNGGCSRERTCYKGEWSFESELCNYEACPPEEPV